MSIEITAFEWVPDFARGFVKDLRVRWALEEADLSYSTRLLTQKDQSSSNYLKRQPFGQVPVYRDDEVELFESGAILIYLAEKHDGLKGASKAAQARATSWVCAALNSIEPSVMNIVHPELFYAGADWKDGFLETATETLASKLARLSDWLGGKDWLEYEFSIGDIMMITVLRDVVNRDYVAVPENLKAYCVRGEARPAFKRAVAAQLADFSDAPA